MCPLKPHIRANHHFQGCLKHQTLLLIAQGHILHHRDTGHLWNWCNTVFPLPKQHGLKTPWPPNLPACAALVFSEPELTEFACLCTKLSTLDKRHSLLVLDQESGQLLEHRQLQQDPCYKEVWACSYSNEPRHLCQGIGTGDKTGGKQVAGTNTFHLIPYLDIPHQKCKEIIYTKVVCEI